MTPKAEVLVIDEIADDMEHSPFGQRWGQQVIEVTPQHLGCRNGTGRS